MWRRFIGALLILGLGAVISLAVWSLADRYERNRIMAAAFDRLSLFHDLRQAALEDYVRSMASDVRAASENPRVVDAMEKLNLAWSAFGPDARKMLLRLYVEQNPTAADREPGLGDAEGRSAYRLYHPKFHEWATRFLKHFGYYDAFLINPRGDIVYSVAKEADFATNLQTGPYRKSPLADVYRRAISNPSAAVDFSDFVPYGPSNSEPAAFAAHAIIKDGELLGAFAVQIPSEPLNDLMHFTAGMGGTGETYLVGADGLMRSQSRFISSPTLLKVKVDNASIRDGIRGRQGSRVVLDYRGTPVLSVYAPVDFGGQKWILLSEIDQAEVLEQRGRWPSLALGGLAGFMAIGLALAWRLRYLRLVPPRKL